MNTALKIKLSTTLFFFSIAFYSYAQSNSKFKVALDAGHGAHDFGAVYNGHIEKNIALAIVLKVGKILEANPNIDVIYTRKTDVFIELVERSNIANRADANIFVSIHCNANKNAAADGTETYVMGLNKNASNLAVAKSENAVITLEKDYKQKYEGFDPNNPSSMIGMTLMQEEYLENSISLASKIQDQFTSGLNRKSRGVKQAPFMVLHKAYMPRVLIETGFISNPKDGALLDSEEGQMQVAEAIANAIISYKKEYFGAGNNEIIERPSKRVIEKPIKDSSIIAKQEKIVEKPVVKTPEIKKESTGVIFKVQIAAVGKKIELIPSNFKGLKNVEVRWDKLNLFSNSCNLS
jgi:N-acetylmuramoyl-L-alanine amidase